MFYTLQVCWKGKIGFYNLYKYKQLLIDRSSFQPNTTPEIMTPDFYLGRFNISKNWHTVIKSKCFNGIISNIEVIQTRNDSISYDLLKLIADKQSVLKWSEFINNKEKDEPSAPKRKKII